MITLLLTRGGDEGVYLKLPASSAEIGESFAELDNISGNSAAPIRIIETLSNVYNLHGYIRNADVGQSDVLDKLIELALKLQIMGRDDCLKFEGVLDANSVNSIDDVLRLADALDDYIVLPDACTSTALGKYLVEHDVGNFPEIIKPYLDYQIIGAEFYADHGGAYCRSGYAVRKDTLPEQLSESDNDSRSKWLIRLRLRVKSVAADLALPATENSMDRAKERLGIDEFAAAEIVVVDYTLPYLATRVPQDCVTVEEANELALAIKDMQQTDGELLKYLSVLEAEQPDTFTEAYRLALDLDDYERITVSADEYGRDVLRRIGADDELLDTIDGFTDFEALGKFYMQEDGVVLTEFGLVRRLSELFEQETSGMMKLE